MSKQIGIYEFVKEHQQNFTVFGLFVALSSYLKTTTDDVNLIGICFFISISMGLSLFWKLLELENNRISQTIYILIAGLFVLLTSLTIFAFSTYTGFASLIIWGVTLYVTFRFLNEIKKIVDKQGWARNKLFYTGVIIVIVSLLYGITTQLQNLSDVPYFIKLSEANVYNAPFKKAVLTGVALSLLIFLFDYFKKIDTKHRIFN